MATIHFDRWLSSIIFSAPSSSCDMQVGSGYLKSWKFFASTSKTCLKEVSISVSNPGFPNPKPVILAIFYWPNPFF